MGIALGRMEDLIIWLRDDLFVSREPENIGIELEG
jgi:hypothetical protein